MQRSHFGHDQLGVGGKELSGSGVTLYAQGTGGKTILGDLHGPGVSEGIAGDLTEDPIVATGIGDNDCGPQLVSRSRG